VFILCYNVFVFLMHVVVVLGLVSSVLVGRLAGKSACKMTHTCIQ